MAQEPQPWPTGCTIRSHIASAISATMRGLSALRTALLQAARGGRPGLEAAWAQLQRASLVSLAHANSWGQVGPRAGRRHGPRVPALSSTRPQTTPLTPAGATQRTSSTLAATLAQRRSGQVGLPPPPPPPAATACLLAAASACAHCRCRASTRNTVQQQQQQQQQQRPGDAGGLLPQDCGLHAGRPSGAAGGAGRWGGDVGRQGRKLDLPAGPVGQPAAVQRARVAPRCVYLQTSFRASSVHTAAPQPCHLPCSCPARPLSTLWMSWTLWMGTWSTA